MPDYAKAKPPKNERVKARAAWQAELVRSLAAHRAEDRKTAMKKLRASPKERKSSYELLRAMDHQLSLIGSGLEQFRISGHYSHKLKAGEEKIR